MKTLALLAALLLPALATAGEAHLFILSGQSNMAGLKPERAFLPELAKLLPDAEIRHVKFTKGGQPIRRWVKNWDEIAAKHDLDPLNDPGSFYDEVLRQARASIAEKKPKTITFFWMQGERDAKEKLSAAYEESLRTLIANLRKDLDVPRMGFVIGRLSDFSTTEHWEAVRAAQAGIAAKSLALVVISSLMMAALLILRFKPSPQLLIALSASPMRLVLLH